MIPYARQAIDQDDIDAVAEVLRSDWLTTGPAVARFEEAFADYVGIKHAVAVSSGTAALHAVMRAIGVGPEDEVIVPAITFTASANAVVYEGARPTFADVDRATLLIDPSDVEAKITSKTKAIIAVDYAGQPCDYDALRAICQKHGLVLVADACHSVGGRLGEKRVGRLADLSVFSFHPVKHIAAGEGGMVVTDDLKVAEAIRRFRNHGIVTDHHQRAKSGAWFYEMVELGYNYRMSDIHCALATSQLAKLDASVARRNVIARRYDEAFANIPGVDPLAQRADVLNAYHLYVVQIGDAGGEPARDNVYAALRARGIGTNVHYIPVYLHSFYQERFGYGPGLCPVAEATYARILSLPMFPSLTDEEVEAVIQGAREVAGEMGLQEALRQTDESA